MHIKKYSLVPVSVPVPSKIMPWIESTTPLTDALVKATGSAEVEVLQQLWTEPDWWDNNVLDLASEKVYLREILMNSHTTPYWYARSIIPNNTYQAAPDFFNRLEHESMRALIFNEPNVVRINKLNYTVDRNCIEFCWVKKYLPAVQGPLWVRYTEFSYSDSLPFYLLEVLFPDLEKITL